MSETIVRPYPQEGIKFLVPPKIIFGKEERIVYLDGVISNIDAPFDEDGNPCCYAGTVCDDLIQLDRESGKPIKMVVDSVGGSLLQGLQIINTIANLRSEVWMVVRQCCSLATTIVAFGVKGHRYILEDAAIHLHGPSLGVGGKAEDVRETMKHIDKQSTKLLDILLGNTKLITEVRDIRALFEARLKEKTGVSNETIHHLKREALTEWLNKERYFDAEEAIKCGIVDVIITPELQQSLFGVKKDGD